MTKIQTSSTSAEQSSFCYCPKTLCKNISCDTPCLQSLFCFLPIYKMEEELVGPLTIAREEKRCLH